MNRIIPAGCLAALFLAGCNSPSQHTPVPRNYGAASDVAVTAVSFLPFVQCMNPLWPWRQRMKKNLSA